MSRSLRGSLVVAALPLAAFACMPPHSQLPMSPGVTANSPGAQAATGPGCAKDSDCKGTRVCESGQCVQAPMSLEAAKDAALGGVAITTLNAILSSRSCHPLSGLDPKLEMLTGGGADQAEEAASFTLELAASNKAFKDAPAAYGAWIMRVRKYKHLCGSKLDDATIAAMTATQRATVSEADVEGAMRGNDCSTLTAIDAGKMWPFKQRFSLEVVGRDFTEAEVTRRLWIKMLSSYKTECVKRLSERQKIAVDARVDKLQRIVGLDDSMLIGLRSQLLDAIDKNQASQVLAYSRAVTEREAQLDQRNATSYRAKLDTMRLELKQKQVKLASVQRAGLAATKTASSASASGKSGGVTLKDVNNAVDTTVKAVDAVNTVGSLFGF